MVSHKKADALFAINVLLETSLKILKIRRRTWLQLKSILEKA